MHRELLERGIGCFGPSYCEACRKPIHIDQTRAKTFEEDEQGLAWEEDV